MQDFLTPLIVPYLLAMFLAVNMGASGTAPAFSTAYNLNLFRKEMIPGIFGVSVLAGAIISGHKVIDTLGTDILSSTYFDIKQTSIILFSIGIALLIANLLGVPQSTSQSTVLSITGSAYAHHDVHWEVLLGKIMPVWFILPLIAFLIMLVLHNWIFPFFKRPFLTDNYRVLSRHPALKTGIVISTIFVGYAIGSNNVGNAAGPIASLTINHLHVPSSEIKPIVFLSVLLVAPCFSIGSSLMGRKVLRATSTKIVFVNPFNALVISLITAFLLLLASVILGVPSSLVQLNTVAFIALSINKKGWVKTLNQRVVKRVFMVWFIAPLLSFILAYLLTRFI